MILHTIVPRELIFQTSETSFETKELYLYNGIPILAEATEDHRLRVSEIISTNPNHYMHPECIPGTIISPFPTEK